MDKQMLPGFSPRPQHHICNKKSANETINSTNKALFVFVKDCQNMEINIVGKVGKVTLEDCADMKVTISDHVVSGVTEVIRCKYIDIHMSEEAEVPTIQVDDSCEVSLYILSKPQIESIYFIRSTGLTLFLENQTVKGEGGLVLQYAVTAPDCNTSIQQVGHWNSSSPDATFVTEAYVREGLTSKTLKSKKRSPDVVAAEVSVQEASSVEYTLSSISSSCKLSERDRNLDLPD